MENRHSDQVIVVKKVLNCSASQAFRYFSEGDLLTKWLTKKAIVELNVGGKFELYWAPEDEDPTNDSTHGCKVLAIDPPHCLSIEWKGNRSQKQFMNSVHPLTNVTFMFFAVEPGKTKVVLLHTGWRKGEEWENARTYFQNVWTGALQNLQNVNI